jgi:hypothetical protein
MRRLFVSGLLTLFAATNAFGLATVRSGAGLAAATTARDQFRADIGGGTVAGTNGSFGGVRREINWDGVPDAFAAPNTLPATFFNVNSPRGVVFSTLGTGFQVSATASSGTPVRFGNIDPSYPAAFVAFSPERLFTPLGSTEMNIHFFIPGTNTPATVSGFGAMFSDVDQFSSVQLFDPVGQTLGFFFVPPADHDVSFVGISFLSGERIARVLISSGSRMLAPGNSAGPNEFCLFPECPGDLVTMDDFIYSEPVILTSVPTLSAPALALLAAALLGIGIFARR